MPAVWFWEKVVFKELRSLASQHFLEAGKVR